MKDIAWRLRAIADDLFVEGQIVGEPQPDEIEGIAKTMREAAQSIDLLRDALRPFCIAVPDHDAHKYKLQGVPRRSPYDLTSGDINRAINALEQVGLSSAPSGEDKA